MTSVATFRNVPCPRMKRGENMVVATRDIRAGERILSRPWLERVSFIVSNKNEVDQCGFDGVYTTFSDDDHKAIGGGTVIDKVFTPFKTAASLQLVCSIILHHSSFARMWVKDKVYVRRNAPGIAPLSVERHCVAIKWLKDHHASTEDLIFWAVRDNFRSIYEMVACNSTDFVFLLSGTTAGLAFCPFLAFFNHDCMPNVVIEHLPAMYTMVALRDIAAGEEICYSYCNDAVGLVALDDIQDFLTARYGFTCSCALHNRTASVFSKVASEPRSLLFTTKRNKTIAMVILSLEEAVKHEQWDVVRRIGRMVWNKYHDLLVDEPCVCFTIGRLYATCIQHSDADEYGLKWCTLIESTLERYCANPMYTVKAYFWTILETIKKCNITTENGNNVEHCFEGCHGEDLKMFLDRWLKIRKYLRRLTNNPEDLLMMDTRLFSGMHAYFSLMRGSMEQLEAYILQDTPAPPSKRKSRNLTRCAVASDLCAREDEFVLNVHERVEHRRPAPASTADPLAPVSQADMEKWIQEANPDFFPELQEKARIAAKEEQKRAKNKKRRERKKAATMPAAMLQLSECFIALAADALGFIAKDDDGDEYFVPNQVFANDVCCV